MIPEGRDWGIPEKEIRFYYRYTAWAFLIGIVLVGVLTVFF